MSDPTEGIRKGLSEVINESPENRETLEKKHGQVWDTEQLSHDFSVTGFMAPFVVVIRMVDSKRGSLEFQHSPRFYFNFKEDTQ